MADAPPPRIGVGGREDDAVGIGPVVVQAFPDPPEPSVTSACEGPRRALRYSLVGAVAKELRAPGPSR